jgi:hypothetical protein
LLKLFSHAFIREKPTFAAPEVISILNAAQGASLSLSLSCSLMTILILALIVADTLLKEAAGGAPPLFASPLFSSLRVFVFKKGYKELLLG